MKHQNIKVKQAWFLILRIKIKDAPWISLFINSLFFLPLPLFIPKLLIQVIPNKVFNEIPFTKKDLKNLIGAKGILVDVKTKENDRFFIKSI